MFAAIILSTLASLSLNAKVHYCTDLALSNQGFLDCPKELRLEVSSNFHSIQFQELTKRCDDFPNQKDYDEINQEHNA